MTEHLIFELGTEYIPPEEKNEQGSRRFIARNLSDDKWESPNGPVLEADSPDVLAKELHGLIKKTMKDETFRVEFRHMFPEQGRNVSSMPHRDQVDFDTSWRRSSN